LKIRRSSQVKALFEKTTIIDSTFNTGVDVPGDQDPDTTGSALDESSVTNAQTTSPDSAAVKTLQILWPVYSVYR